MGITNFTPKGLENHDREVTSAVLERVEQKLNALFFQDDLITAITRKQVKDIIEEVNGECLK